jgi:hypothetical protein
VSTERLVGVAADLIWRALEKHDASAAAEAWLVRPYRRQRPATQAQPGPCLTQAPGTHTA